MVDILHRIGVRTPDAAKVYEALTNVDGLAGWWTVDTKGNSAPGGVLEFRFSGGNWFRGLGLDEPVGVHKGGNSGGDSWYSKLGNLPSNVNIWVA